MTIGQLSIAALSRFVDHSLLNHSNKADDGPSFTIHELLRQYLAERRTDVPYMDATARQAHCDYYAQWLTDFDALRQENFAAVPLHPFSGSIPQHSTGLAVGRGSTAG